MKNLIYLAAAVLAAAACGREPAVTETPSTEPEEEKLIEVTLIAGNPDTRTEVFFDPEVNAFRPYWSAGVETISLGPVLPQETGTGDLEFDEDGYFYPDEYAFSSPQEASRSLERTFIGRAPAGTYLAYYPAWNDYVYDDDGNLVQEGYGASLYYDRYLTATVGGWVQTLQYPRRDSFDPKSDFLVSNPVTIDGNSNVAQPVYVAFSRPVAIVRVVLQDKQGAGSEFPLAGQHVRRVILGSLDGEGPYLSVDVKYYYPGNGSDIRVEYEGYDFVVAEYTDETTYTIGEEGAATFFITIPTVLKQEENPLHIQVETDDYVIDRDITLPADVALQPSRMTTLNIGLFDDGVNGTGYQRKGMVFMVKERDEDSGEETLVPVESLEVAFGEEVSLYVQLAGVYPPYGVLNDFEFGPEESAVMHLSFDATSYDDEENLLREIVLRGVNVGSDTFTVRLVEGWLAASLPVSVVPGEHDRFLDGNYGDDNKPGGGINSGNTVIIEGEL